MKNFLTLCFQAFKSSKYLKIQRENIKNLKLFYFFDEDPLRWLLLPFYNSKGSSVTIRVLKPTFQK